MFLHSLFCSLLLLVCVCHANHSTKVGSDDDGDPFRAWRQGVQEVIATISTGPLKEQFTPTYLEKRHIVHALEIQKARLRAKIASALIYNADTRADFCFERSFCDTAIAAIKKEFENHGFTIQWQSATAQKTQEMELCWKTRYVFSVFLPPPATTMGNEEKEK